MVVMKIRVSVSSLSKVQLRHPWQESIFVICKTHTRCLHILFYVRISRGTGATGLDNVLLDSSFSFIQCDGFTLQVYIKQ